MKASRCFYLALQLICKQLFFLLSRYLGDLTPAMVAIAKLADKDLDPESAEEVRRIEIPSFWVVRLLRQVQIRGDLLVDGMPNGSPV